MMDRLIRHCGRVLAIGSLMTLSTVVAQDLDSQVKPGNPGFSSATPAASEKAELPSCLRDLDLSPTQQTQIQKVLRDADAEITSVWQQFGDRYMVAIRTEAQLLCAIEDNLTDAQRMRVHQQRHRVAQREKSVAGTRVRPNKAATKTESAVEEQIAIAGVSLTSEQEAAAEACQEKYRSSLRSLNRDIDGLHTRLLSLEADKFVDIEKILTEEQLQKLRKVRQNAHPSTSEKLSSRSKD